MAETKEIVWIGKKEEKRVNRQGRDYFFPRGTPVSVPEQIAFDLLQLRSCFATPDAAEKIVEQLNNEAETKERLKQAAAEEKLKRDKANTWKVYVDGEKVNISKYPKAKLETIIISEEIVADPTAVDAPEGTPPVELLRMAVRDALHAKSGNPELAEDAEG
ncbi:TPA: hypothetical protein P0E30_003765 [Vibrio harveyi]|nr:hypothetical protein [Vibrio harveyi]